jgi:hypothetical protein
MGPPTELLVQPLDRPLPETDLTTYQQSPQDPSQFPLWRTATKDQTSHTGLRAVHLPNYHQVSLAERILPLGAPA